jgi:hypothetical protein
MISCSGWTFYFENFLLYTFPSAMLLCALTALFHLAITRKRFRWWLLFFTACVGLGLLRATFHMLWLLMVLGIALIFEQKQYKVILRAFIAPFGLLLIFYLKNLFIFGFFGVSSWGGFNLSLNTHNRIPLEARQALVSQGELSPIYGIHPYSGPDAYQAIFDLGQEKGIPALDQKMRALRRPNYNHWIYAEVSPMKMRDSWQFIRENPGQYFRTVGFNAKQFLGPSTEWHPRAPDFSPHAPHQEIIGGYERLYNRLLHSFPINGVGVYIFFPWVLLVILIRTGFSLLKSRFRDRLQQK